MQARCGAHGRGETDHGHDPCDDARERESGAQVAFASKQTAHTRHERRRHAEADDGADHDEPRTNLRSSR
jgi:hypothetical protein